MCTRSDFSPIDPSDYLKEEYKPTGMVTYFDASDLAMINYGKYITSGHRSGFRLMQRIYAKFGSMLPEKARSVMRQENLFSENAVVFPMCKQNRIEGYKYIGLVKFVELETSEDWCTVDASRKPPRLILKEQEEWVE